MRGHLPLIAMRLKRRSPGSVSLNVGPQSDWLADHWHETEGLLPHILVEPTDPIDRLDLRFVVGLTVDVSGHVEHRDRVLRVFDACTRAGASRVIGALHQPKAGGLVPVEYFDTGGVLTWLA